MDEHQFSKRCFLLGSHTGGRKDPKSRRLSSEGYRTVAAGKGHFPETRLREATRQAAPSAQTLSLTWAGIVLLCVGLGATTGLIQSLDWPGRVTVSSRSSGVVGEGGVKSYRKPLH